MIRNIFLLNWVLKKEIHFSVENLKITRAEDVEKIENIWLVRQTLPDCLKTINT